MNPFFLIKSVLFFRWGGGYVTESSRQNLSGEEPVESAVHELCSDTDWWSAGQHRRKFMLDRSAVRHDGRTFRDAAVNPLFCAQQDTYRNDCSQALMSPTHQIPCRLHTHTVNVESVPDHL